MSENIVGIAVKKMRSCPIMNRVRVRPRETPEKVFGKYAVAFCMTLNRELAEKELIPWDATLIRFYAGHSEKKDALRFGKYGEALVEFEVHMTPQEKLSVLMNNEDQLRKKMMNQFKKTKKNEQTYDKIFGDIFNEIRRGVDGKVIPLSYKRELTPENQFGIFHYHFVLHQETIFTARIDIFKHESNLSSLKYQFKKKVVHEIHKRMLTKKQRRELTA